MFVWLLLSSKFGFLVCLVGVLHIVEIERYPRLGVLGVDLMELTSLDVSKMVELLILREGHGSIFSLQAAEDGDIINRCCGATRLNGDEKSSRNVSKWFSVIIKVQPRVFWRSSISKKPLAA